jgi:hypothetical protein
LGIKSKKDGLNQGWCWELAKVPSGAEGALQNERAPSGVEGTFGSQERSPVEPDGGPNIGPPAVDLAPAEQDYLGPPGDDSADLDIPTFLRR